MRPGWDPGGPGGAWEGPGGGPGGYWGGVLGPSWGVPGPSWRRLEGILELVWKQIWKISILKNQ